MSEDRRSFVDRLLDGDARLDQFEATVAAWLTGPKTRPLGDVLGLAPDELDLVATTPDALRYVVRARRFGLPLDLASVRGQSRVRSEASRLAADVADPWLVAELEAWQSEVDAAAAGRAASGAGSHA